MIIAQRIFAYTLFAFIAVFFIFIFGFEINNDRHFEKHHDPFDYAMVGVNIWQGNGITLEGQPYVVLPPGFAVVAGALNRLIKDPQIAVTAASTGFWLLSLWMFYLIVKKLFIDVFLQLTGLLLYISNYQMMVNAAGGWAEPMFVCGMMALTLLLLKDKTRLSFSGMGIEATVFGVLSAVIYYTKPEGLYLSVLLWIIYLRRLSSTWLVKLWLSAALFAVMAALMLPYLHFLKENTGRWQISGKTYINLVMGELQSPYQTMVTNTENIYERYTIIEKVQRNPAEAKSLPEYLTEPENDILKRVPVNLYNIIKVWWYTFSIVGIALAITGMIKIRYPAGTVFLAIISVMLFYLFFFILARFVSAYHWIFYIYMIAGLKAVSEYLSGKKILQKYIQAFSAACAGFIVLYQLRFPVMKQIIFLLN